MPTIVQILLIVISLAGSIISGLVLFNLQAINSRQIKLEGRQDQLEKDMKLLAAKPAECVRDFTSKEDWVRSEGYTRKELKEITIMLARMEGKLNVTEKLPEIAGQIAREVVKQVQSGGLI